MSHPKLWAVIIELSPIEKLVFSIKKQSADSIQSGFV